MESPSGSSQEAALPLLSIRRTGGSATPSYKRSATPSSATENQTSGASSTSSRTASTAWTIQPVATQIAKLRFFISLAIEQQPTTDRSDNYGIKTGYNKAFIFDDATKGALIAADPKSVEIIKPVLRGRDIQRYRSKWAGLWLIYVRRGLTIDRYPAVYKHLSQHRQALSKKAGQNQWHELQASPSDLIDSNFHKEKLLWMDMSPRGRFAYSNAEMYCNDKGFIMTGSFSEVPLRGLEQHCCNLIRK